jgi:hypothetical protein
MRVWHNSIDSERAHEASRSTGPDSDSKTQHNTKFLSCHPSQNLGHGSLCQVARGPSRLGSVTPSRLSQNLAPFSPSLSPVPVPVPLLGLVPVPVPVTVTVSAPVRLSCPSPPTLLPLQGSLSHRLSLSDSRSGHPYSMFISFILCAH